jgi:Predicted DNA-binding proteins
LPQSNKYGPLNAPINEDHFVVMTVDEYESIRLIDLKGFTQEECANQMNIARTTVQGIYNDARKKLAESLVNGKILRIEGGDYKLCSGLERHCDGGGCRRHRCGRSFEKSGEKDV